MKYIFFSFSILIFACNNSKTNTPATQQPTTQQDDEIKVHEPVLPKEPEAYFTANGSDWSVDLKSAINGTFPLVLIQNNGKDTVMTTLNRVMEGNGKPASGKSSVNFTGVVKNVDKEETLELNIFPGACTGKGGEKTNFTCKISIGKKALSGCGTYTDL